MRVGRENGKRIVADTFYSLHSHVPVSPRIQMLQSMLCADVLWCRGHSRSTSKSFSEAFYSFSSVRNTLETVSLSAYRKKLMNCSCRTTQKFTMTISVWCRRVQ